jgi:hypothetical protein
MACVSYAPGMARKMAEHIRGCPDYARQLHTIYLANDILLKSCAASPSNLTMKATCCDRTWCACCVMLLAQLVPPA